MFHYFFAITFLALIRLFIFLPISFAFKAYLHWLSEHAWTQRNSFNCCACSIASHAFLNIFSPFSLARRAYLISVELNFFLYSSVKLLKCYLDLEYNRFNNTVASGPSPKHIKDIIHIGISRIKTHIISVMPTIIKPSLVRIG